MFLLQMIHDNLPVVEGLLHDERGEKFTEWMDQAQEELVESSAAPDSNKNDGDSGTMGSSIVQGDETQNFCSTTMLMVQYRFPKNYPLSYQI